MSKQLIEKILSNSASSVEKEKFDKWLKESQINQEYYSQAKVIWERVDGVFPQANVDKNSAKQIIRSRVQKNRRKIIRLKWLPRIAVAASILLIITFSLLKINDYSNMISEVHSSGNLIQNVQLSDGTQVWLNRNSKLSIPKNYAIKNRTVLLRGEAYFEVKRDESKPFMVITGKTVTKVLGTSFNIEQDTLRGKINLNVNSGKVAFYRKHWLGSEYFLTTGAFAQFLENENRILVGKNESLNCLAWKTGKLKFYDTPISQVCNDLSKFYGITIKANINDKTILTGTFDHEALDDILSIIKLSLGLTIRDENGIIVLDK